MVRGGGGAKKEKEENAEAEERKRLKKLAFKNNILSETQATASGSNALNPSATVVKHHGKDIMRKSQRSGKNRYLFSFPGLLGPVSGGKVGELKDLGTKNPVLYLDFPQGQMKLFGTIVYPKNRYLTLQFSKTGKNVTCEDYFDNMIVFSDAWWIGKKDENPEEVRLEFPKEMDVEQVQNYDFKGGAGGPSDSKRDSIKTAKKVVEQPSPKFELEEDSSDSQHKPKEVLELTPSRKSARTDSSDSQNKPKEVLELTPSRKSARTAGKTFKFAESSSGDDIADGLGETSGDDFVNNGLESSEGDGDNVAKETGKSCHVVLDLDKEDAETDAPVPKKRKQSAKSASKTKELAHSNQGSLVQKTISSLFKKAGEKVVHTDANEKIDNVKISRPSKKGKPVGKRKDGTESSARKKKMKVEDDDIEEFTSTSQDMISSDEDWTT
ncbi:DNA-binding protein RHL1 isoform X2 [Coffea eugenioides]|uniref:DNA-binding protein RHL1 isoform X2 n=1 Tax=Coffea eugenioides TaxID=49369 RepID=UPI000F615C15|nr:DNA-binding protein RHL1 isoform X2 [Coffea eugenioides]